MPKWQKGQSGNPKGRPPGPGGLEDLRKAIKTVEASKKKKFFIHAVEQAYEDRTVLISILKKLIPDLKHLEGDLTHDVGKELMSLVAEAMNKHRKPK